MPTVLAVARILIRLELCADGAWRIVEPLSRVILASRCVIRVTLRRVSAAHTISLHTTRSVGLELRADLVARRSAVEIAPAQLRPQLLALSLRIREFAL